MTFSEVQGDARGLNARHGLPQPRQERFKTWPPCVWTATVSTLIFMYTAKAETPKNRRECEKKEEYTVITNCPVRMREKLKPDVRMRLWHYGHYKPFGMLMYSASERHEMALQIASPLTCSSQPIWA